MISVILDCDGVLLDWCGGFRTYLWKSRGLRVNGSVPGDFSMSDWTGLRAEEASRLAAEFNSDIFGGFHDLEPEPGAQEGVSLLLAAGANLRILSSAGTSEQTINLRARNLKHHFGDVFEDTILLPIGQSKRSRLATLSPSIFVDDMPKNAMDAHMTGHDALVLRHHANREMEADYPDLIWVNTLEEAAHHILDQPFQVKEASSLDFSA